MLDLLKDGIEIAALGMTAVFVLLGCLVLAVAAMSRLTGSLTPASHSARPAAAPGGFSNEAELTVAVTAAIHAYRAQRRKGPDRVS